MKLFGPRYPEEIAKRIPPGQRLVKTWPVLHFGPIPDFDESTWNLEVNGLVDNPYSLTYDELKALGPIDVQADMHCV
ncbi:MAG TPA: molybdopterin-dependent oxidoreductase, partial [Actinomycetota bacterium]|nr:molybdopterin-dependent oxidoreductase [Actinomycetota bacterium]